MPVTEEIEEDFLEVDKQIPGQNYVCLSFVSPEKILNQKEKFLFYHYQRLRLLNYKKLLVDGVHPNKKGYLKMERIISKTLKKIL